MPNVTCPSGAVLMSHRNDVLCCSPVALSLRQACRVSMHAATVSERVGRRLLLAARIMFGVGSGHAVARRYEVLLANKTVRYYPVRPASAGIGGATAKSVR